MSQTQVVFTPLHRAPTSTYTISYKNTRRDKKMSLSVRPRITLLPGELDCGLDDNLLSYSYMLTTPAQQG